MISFITAFHKRKKGRGKLMENKGGQNTENQAAITVLLASEH